MNILIVGGGGREHAILKSIKKSPLCGKIYCLPGNGGIACEAECVDISTKDIKAITTFAIEKKIDFAIVAPDDPLVLGAVDELEKVGISCFGPNKAAAIIEGSKAFSKSLMQKYNIPTADYQTFDNADKAIQYILNNNVFPIVIKADGLALGKGVIIAENFEEAKNAVESIMLDKAFGDSGNKIVVEEFLTGPEVSVLSFTDGKAIIPMVSSMDHKRALDDDKGLNTGGMGTIAPNPYYTKSIADECMKSIFIPTMNAMNSEGRAFKGCLYFGLMLTEKGPKVIEYNCRFGDPETQVVLPLLESDLLEIMIAVSKERLSETKVTFKDGAACCVIIASGGYPQDYKKGKKISFDGIVESGNILIYHAGTKKAENGDILTSGGRVLGVTATGKDLTEAIKNAYEQTDKITFEGSFYRHDIGRKALNYIRK
ncbi:MAG: phosphoribosylamine--glycine ligase [Clostridiales bacterium GWF2_36_10]|nr:MAG: phosphoribosylamine--glycine ligase [Clostridiales bacterium GWF2_36_10]HAN21148.1 phosphoribosylamine--glycine ligase [Clostridiales bacterium]